MDCKPTILTGGEKRSDDQIMAAHEKKSVKRVSDTFDIISKVPAGTTVMCGFKIGADK